MQRFGLALHLSSSRNIIVKVESSARIGDMVVDEDLKSVGKVLDMFGPVSSPYAALKPAISNPERLLKKRLYVLPSKRRKEKKRNEW